MGGLYKGVLSKCVQSQNGFCSRISNYAIATKYMVFARGRIYHEKSILPTLCDIKLLAIFLTLGS